MSGDTQPFSFILPDISQWLTSFGHWLVGIYPSLVSGVKGTFGIVILLSFVLSLFFLIGIIYCVEGLKKIRKREEEIHDLKVEPGFDVAQTGDTVMAHRWDNALKLVESDNPNDWKQAIMEADIILDDLLMKMGYRGESVGEKLKRVELGDMKSLDEAWEAHKVRNQVAHGGSDFVLNQHDVKRVMHMYKKVFEEFYYI